MLSSSQRVNGGRPQAIKVVQGTGEMAGRVRTYAWDQTELGPIDQWPLELLTVVNMMLASREIVTIFWGPDRLMIYNDQYTSQLGIRHPASLGRPLRDVWPEVVDQVKHLLDPVFASGTSTYVEDAPLTVIENGVRTERVYSISCEPIWLCAGSDSSVQGVYQTAINNTAKVQAERRLRATEAQATRVLQNIGDAVIVTDADGSIVQMNPVAESLTRWAFADAQGKPLSEVFRIVHEQTRETAEDLAGKVRRLNTVTGLQNHTILIGKDASETHIEDSAAPIRSGTGVLTGVVVVFRDVEVQRAAERERQRLATQMEQILAASTDGVALLDRNWNFTYFNRRGREVVQLEENAEDVVGKNAWEMFPGMLFENSPYVYHYYRAMDEGIAGSFVTEYPEPLNISIQVFVRPIPDGILVTFRDITEQKLATAALLQSEKLAAVGRLASTIAHEINNPLESVTNLLYLAKGSEDPREIREYLDTAERELRRVSVISNQTLRFNKQLSGPNVVSCTYLFSEALSIYHGRIVNSQITVEKRKRAKRSTECVEGEVRQVLSNFLSNAIDAMNSGGGRLILRSREGTRWKTGQQGLVLTVADTGPGIPLEKQKKIFEAFYSTKGMGGTGLGLWISKEIAERHQGAINFRSSTRKGKSGTVFTLFLPFEAAPR